MVIANTELLNRIMAHIGIHELDSSLKLILEDEFVL